MKQISATQFEAHCLALLDEVWSTGKSIVVTKDGKPLVKLVPAKAADQDIFGFMVGKGKIVGDIVSPVTSVEDWDAVK